MNGRQWMGGTVLAAAIFACDSGAFAVDVNPAHGMSATSRSLDSRLESGIAKVGQLAPGFTLDAVVNGEFKKVGLADY
ncbi:MAG TPA: hypothetical protein VFY07_01695, partial [Geomobilimonas sp.]|nr:hypothetical protein [Geomobilimonas sp.]